MRQTRAKLRLLALEGRDLPAIIGAPGFESPALNGGAFAYAPAFATWTFSPSSGITANGSAFSAANSPAPEGGQAVFIQNTGSISQAITLSGGTYVIDFAAAQRANVPSKQTLQVLVDGFLVGSFNDLTNTFYSAEQTTTFKAAAGTHTITFLGTNLLGGDNTMFIDQVAINQVATPVVDSGFEVPGLAPNAYKYNPSGSAWTFSTNSGISQSGSGFTAFNPPSPQGSQVAFVQANGSVSQVLTLTAGTYTISFAAAQRSGQSQTLQVLVSGTLVGNYDSISGPGYSQLVSSTFTVATGSQTITFQGTNIFGGDNTLFLDNVAINFEPARYNDSGFELAGLARGKFQYQPTGTPWTFSPSSGITSNASGFTSGNPPAPQGNEVAFLQQNGSFSQIAAFAPGTYEISFFAAQRGNAASAQTFQLLVDGQVVGTYNRLTGAGYVGLVSSSFSVTAGNHTISFQGTNLNGGDNTAFIDQVTVHTQSTSLTDTGFEQPVLANNAFLYGPSSAWLFTGTAGVSASSSGFTSGNPVTPQGNQVLFLQQAGTARQVVDFNAGTYQINFLAAQRGNVASNQTFQVLVDGVLVTSFNVVAGAGYSQQTTSSFTVGAGSHTVTFQGTNLRGGDNTVFIDDVAIVPQAVNMNDNGFETPSLAFNAFKYGPTGTAWTYTGTAGVSSVGSAFTSGNPLPPQGSNVLFLQQSSTASQVVSFTEGTYGLSFLAAQRGNVRSVQTFQVLIDGFVLGTFNNVSGIGYQSLSTPNFTVSTGNHTITFRGTNLNGGDNTIFVDAVTVH